MPRKPSPRPTDGELEILQILWKLGGRNTREIADELGKRNKERPSASAVMTRLKIMLDKELVREDTQRTPKLYYAAVAERRMKRSLVQDFVRRVFGGSDESMIMHALKDDSATPEEIAELRKRLKDLRGKS